MDQERGRLRGRGGSLITIPTPSPLNVAIVSTVPPRQCGIATFAENLCAAMRGAEAPIDLEFVAIEHADSVGFARDDVRWRISQGDRASFIEVADSLNRSNVDVVCVEHEFGLYGTSDGEYLDHLGPFLAALRPPAVITLHTVLPAPVPSMLAAIQHIALHSAAVVVMAHEAARLLTGVYDVAPEKVHVIPHGVPVMAHGEVSELRDRLGLAGRTVVTTFGLVDPRKGLEFMVDAMEVIVARHPDAIYLILGRTHPELLAHEGERYRSSLIATIEDKGLAGHVRMVDEYLSEQAIIDYLAVSDIYVTPYLDPAQITSGTLAYALGAGKAVVSTAYLHAIEALAEERGLLVGFRSALELASAVLRIIEEPGLRQRLEANAHRAGRHTAWPNVALRMMALLQDVVDQRLPSARPFARDLRPFLLSGGRS